MKLSIVLPVYNNQETLHPLISGLHREFSLLRGDWEIIAVDDGSKDSSWAQIQKAVRQFKNVVGMRHSRNFGQHPAILTGVQAAQGDFVLVMDSDFQDQPSDARHLYLKARTGWDVVQGKRIFRKDRWIVRWRSRFFHRLFLLLSGIQTNSEVANFCVYSRRTVSAYLSCPEQNKIMCLFVKLLGFRQTSIAVEHRPRTHGQSGYSWWGLCRLAGLAIFHHSKIPLYFGIILGFCASLSAGAAGIWILGQKFFHHIKVPGWASLGVLLTFLSGTMFLIVGILGLYIGLVLDEIRSRPQAVVSEVCRPGPKQRKRLHIPKRII